MMPKSKSSQPVDITKDIIKKIDGGDIKMHSKIHYMIKRYGLVLGIVLSFLLAIIFFSYFLYACDRESCLEMLEFGSRGFGLLMLSRPVLFFLIATFLIAAMVLMVKHIGQGYKRRWQFWFLVVIVLSALFSFMFNALKVHPVLEEHLGPRSHMIEEAYRRPVQGLGGGQLPAIVLEVDDDIFVLGCGPNRVEIEEDEVLIRPRQYQPVVGDKVMIIQAPNGEIIGLAKLKRAPGPNYGCER